MRLPRHLLEDAPPITPKVRVSAHDRYLAIEMQRRNAAVGRSRQAMAEGCWWAADEARNEASDIQRTIGVYILTARRMHTESGFKNVGRRLM